MPAFEKNQSWQTDATVIQPDRVIRYTIRRDDEEITFRDFLSLLIGSKTFRSYYNDLLTEAPFDAFFWEHPPISAAAADRTYEFVLVNSTSLARVPPNAHAFSAHFSDDSPVVDFPNLGGDAHLVVPSPQSQPTDYTHLAAFCRQAPTAQRDAFWQCVGQQHHSHIQKEIRWLSTSGLGVYWLHVRIDTRPKYYQHRPYRS